MPVLAWLEVLALAGGMMSGPNFSLERQPPPLLFVVVFGDSLFPGFVGAQSPAAAAQFPRWAA